MHTLVHTLACFLRLRHIKVGSSLHACTSHACHTCMHITHARISHGFHTAAQAAWQSGAQSWALCLLHSGPALACKAQVSQTTVHAQHMQSTFVSCRDQHIAQYEANL